MSGTTAHELGSVQKTLLLPLWGRAVETRKARPLLVDETAVRIVESIDYDFSTMFDAELRAAREAGFEPVESPSVRRSRTALLVKVRAATAL